MLLNARLLHIASSTPLVFVTRHGWLLVLLPVLLLAAVAAAPVVVSAT